MRYITIDTRQGRFGIMTSRKKVELFTHSQVKAHTLVTLFWGKRRKSGAEQTYCDDRYIILPVSEYNMIYADEALIDKISSYLNGKD